MELLPFIPIIMYGSEAQIGSMGYREKFLECTLELDFYTTNSQILKIHPCHFGAFYCHQLPSC